MAYTKRVETKEVESARYPGMKYERRTVVITCCGQDIYCTAATQTCGICGSDYNTAGQKLAPRSQWGEETGEHPTECY